MTRSLRAHFDGKVIVLDEPADLPTHTPLKVEVTLESEATSEPKRRRGILADLADWAESLPIDPDSPGDRAAQHDHYLYGTPKRADP
jgi:hypothetical protein